MRARVAWNRLLVSFSGRCQDIEETYGDYSAEVHLFPFRTEKLSPAAPMILHKNCGKVGRRHPHNGSPGIELGLSCFVPVLSSFFV